MLRLALVALLLLTTGPLTGCALMKRLFGDPAAEAARAEAAALAARRQHELEAAVAVVRQAVELVAADRRGDYPSYAELEALVVRPGHLARLPANPWSPAGAPCALVAADDFPVHLFFAGAPVPAAMGAPAPEDPLRAAWLDPRARQPGTLVYHADALSEDYFVVGIGEAGGRPAVAAGTSNRYSFRPAR